LVCVVVFLLLESAKGKGDLIAADAVGSEFSITEGSSLRMGG
jgi:hypothetical protein